MLQGVFGAVAAHFFVVLLGLIIVFAITIPRLFKFWFCYLPPALIIGFCAGLIANFIRAEEMRPSVFWLAFVSTFLSFPIAAIFNDYLVFELNLWQESVLLRNLSWGLAYILIGVGIEIIMAFLAVFAKTLWTKK